MDGFATLYPLGILQLYHSINVSYYEARAQLYWQSCQLHIGGVQDCTGCTETLLRPSHPDLGDLILNVISLEYHETLMAGLGKQAEEALAQAARTTRKVCLRRRGFHPNSREGR